MKIGVVVRSFVSDPSIGISMATKAEAIGLDGVFVFDHLWPLGSPNKPALAAFPMLAALAGVTKKISIGTLVARVGLVPNPVLINHFVTLEKLSKGRVIAGVGTGDKMSAVENISYGLGYGSALERRRSLYWGARELQKLNIKVWIGGGSEKTNQIATDLGIGLNLWSPALPYLSQQQNLELTWAGPIPKGEGSAIQRATQHIFALSKLNVKWAIFDYSFSDPVQKNKDILFVLETVMKNLDIR